MWVFLTSNERLFRHTLPASACGSGRGFSQSHPSHADEILAKKKVSVENLEAVRARFIELYVHEKPFQSQNDLDAAGNFSRSHFILGTFDRALRLLEHYQLTDFHSAHLSAYVVSALVKHVDRMEEVMCESSGSAHLDEERGGGGHRDCVHGHRQRIRQLVEKFNVCLV
jgi:hypothetical protein